MARIPVVQDPSVRTEGLPTPYARPFATPQGQGAGFGDVLEGAARVASDYVQEARQKADAASIQGAWGQAQDALNKTILDPEKGYSSLRGSDAMAGREKALGTYNKALDGINEG
jgi:flagellar hook-basal body complex protein FliE